MRTYCENDIVERISKDEMKAALTRMLAAFAEFCDARGLRYYLSGGTLLGAVRHRGFIPWDDDVDVNMPRPDCEKLMELTGGRIGDYVLNPPNDDCECHAYYWKLYDDGVLLRKDREARIVPIFIDIFPIEGLPETAFGNVLHYAHVRFWKAWMSCLWRDRWFHGHSFLARLCHAAFRPVALLWGRRRLFDRVVATMKSIPFGETSFIGVMATKIHTTEERVPKSDYLRVVDVAFEGRRFHGPANAEVYLSQLYGPDYMELPPESKRRTHGFTPFRSVFSGGSSGEVT